MPVGLGVTATIEAILGAPATNDTAGFDTLFDGTETKIGEVTAVTGLGGTAQVINFTPLETGVIEKYLGSIDYNNTTIAFGKDFTDAGQVLLTSAFDGANARAVHSFRITTPEGHLYEFSGRVMSDVNDGFQPNEIVTGSCEIVRSSAGVITAA